MQWTEGSPSAFSHGTQVVVQEGIHGAFSNNSATIRQQHQPS